MITDHNQDNKDTVVDSVYQPADDLPESQVRNLFRPLSFDDYIGQTDVKNIIKMLIDSAKSRSTQLDHILLHGLPGLGKTTLAQIIANEFGGELIVTSGQALDKPGDVAALLSNISKGGILFVDEIHRLKPKVEEMLYTAMEDFVIDLVLGKGVSAKTMRLELNSFTLVGSTTMPNKLTRPLRDRFGVNVKLESYSIEDLTGIISNNAEKLKVNLPLNIKVAIAACSRSTPRIANHLLKRFVDFITVHSIDSPVLADFESFSEFMKIDKDGLCKTDIELLNSILLNFDCGPVGLKTLSASINEDPDNVELLYEPFLMQRGLLARTHRGRLLTQKGIEFARKI